MVKPSRPCSIGESKRSKRVNRIFSSMRFSQPSPLASSIPIPVDWLHGSLTKITCARGSVMRTPIGLNFAAAIQGSSGWRVPIAVSKDESSAPCS